MATTHSSILLHIIFSTKNRQPLITAAIEHELYAYIGGVCKNSGSILLEANGTTDHCHLLVSLGKTISIADLMLQVKRDSSTWIKTKGPEFAEFHWQEGYAALSIGRSQIDQVRGYIAKQKDHHRTVSFREELVEFLRRYDIPFDDRYSAEPRYWPKRTPPGSGLCRGLTPGVSLCSTPGY